MEHLDIGDLKQLLHNQQITLQEFTKYSTQVVRRTREAAPAGSAAGTENAAEDLVMTSTTSRLLSARSRASTRRTRLCCAFIMSAARRELI